MGGYSSGPSQYEIEARQKAAEEAERKKQAAKDAAAQAAANASPKTGEASGGGGSSYEGGALAGVKRKKGSTTLGEGAQTFGQGGTLGS